MVVSGPGAVVGGGSTLGVALGIGTVAEANQFFLNQWGPTRFNSAAHPFGYMDCGPTSAVMALCALGIIPHPGPSAAEAVITWERNLERNIRPTTTPTMSGPTYLPMEDQGLIQSGAAVAVRQRSLPAIDAALARGSVVLVPGDPREAWGLRASANGNYLHHYDPSNPKDRFGHWVVIFGKSADGNYIVGDPLQSNGAIARAPFQVRTYLASEPTWSIVEVSRRA
jgi:hypothetical protein